MSRTKRWLDELPLESPERELLLVGKSARPVRAQVDEEWRALSLLLGSAAGLSHVNASGIVAKSASAKAGSSVLASKAASGALWVVSAKSLALGVAIGLGVMGAGAAVENLRDRARRPATVAKRPAVLAAHAPSIQRAPARSASVPGDVEAVQAIPVQRASSGAAASSELLAASNVALNRADVPSPSAEGSPMPESASLSRQARELAELKRLIDSGAAVEALRRLDASFSADAASALSEERDALYVQALDRAQRRDEARFLARRFLTRYPRSPYFEAMRRLLANE